ncbi:MAG: DEAD/DEAH box helicase [Verrucomicrobia bacterium]|nr:DEAD/DEAH box helicase [Verrucomicrobiota bacterium]
MDRTFELSHFQEAEDFLAGFDRATRMRGEAYVRERRVEAITCIEPGARYVATVRGTQVYETLLLYDEADGWSGECTCPMEFDCKHVYAALKTLLAAPAAAAVGNPGARSSRSRPPAARFPVASRVPPDSELASRLAAAAGRPLRPGEAAFVRKVHGVYARCRSSQRISNWDFGEMGFRMAGNSWELLRLWTVFPDNDYEFWLHVAHALRERGVPVPKCALPVTDLSHIEAQITRARRRAEIDRWKRLLGTANQLGIVPPHRPTGLLDLRLVILDDMAALQWKRPGRPAFEPIKPSHVRQLAADVEDGHAELTPEAQILWEAWRDRSASRHYAALRYGGFENLEPLGRVLRLRSLHDRIVTAEGQPMERPADPLRWHLLPAADEADDYQFKLVGADGNPPPPILCMFEGHPSLCLTLKAVFNGPPTCTPLLPVDTNIRIPAPALETRAGLQFLESLQVPMPPRMANRVRHVPMEVAVQCELAPSWPGGRTEYCHLHVVAQSADGQVRETWEGHTWTKTRPPPLHNPSGDAPIVLYDRSLMHEVPRLLEPLALKPSPNTGRLMLRVTRKFPELFVAWLRSLPPFIQVRLAGELASLAQDAVSGQVRLDVTEADIDWFDLKVVLDVADTTLTREEIRLLLRARGAFVRLKNKGWRRLQFNLDPEDDERLARLGLNPRELTDEPQRLHALQLADDAARRFLPEAQVQQIQRRASDIKTRVTPDLPPGVTAELRPYQRDGFHFLAYLAANRFGGILADDMGLGKTVQALAWLVWLRQSPPPAASAVHPPPRPSAAKPSLVVCPKSVMDNWRAEAARFTPGLRVKLWPASELDTFLRRLSEADLHVLNYSQLRIVGEPLGSMPWLAVILDEGQYIKNPNSQTAQVARVLRADHRLVLTGTPIENRLLDLWSLMAFAMPGVLSSRHHFAKLFDAKDDPFARRRLASRVRPFLLRRTKTQVAKDLPDRIEEDLFCDIEGEQKTLYRAELKRAQQLLLRIQTQKQLAKERFHFLTSLLRLRQICCHPALVNPGTKAESAKVNALVEQLEPLMAEDNKVLVFSQFVEMLALLKTAIAQQGWPQFYLAGDTENRGDLVARFQAAEGPAVFLISLKAGGFGLNLTAASYVVLFDPWWNPAVENQAIDRTHRIGQTNKVIAYRLLIKDSIEEKIRALQRRKKALAEDVLGEEKFAQSLTLEDLHYLFAD